MDSKSFMIEAVADHHQMRGGPSRTWSRTFPGRPDQIRHARQCLAPILDSCPVADDAILCLSELATNSVIHSDSRKPGGTFTVRAEIRDGEYVRLEVRDGGGPWLERRHTHGRSHGLAIVRDLATDSGVSGDALSGRIAWARLDWPGRRRHRRALPWPRPLLSRGYRPCRPNSPAMTRPLPGSARAPAKGS